ncbi:MAG: hypothetical protein E7075_01610, partial [Bacteroidales bacterium]|nr:hypothetical protein [Bacteroidales bacterium]
MKKIITLFMAMVVTMSMSALPLQVKTSKEGPVKHQTESSIKKAEQMEKMKLELPNAEMQRTAAPLAKKAPAKAIAANAQKVAPAAKTDDVAFIELNYDAFATGPEYTEESESWWVGLQTMDESRPEYGVMIQLDWKAPADDFTGTFTTEDFTRDYTWALTDYCMGYIQFDSISMTISKEASENMDVITLDAVLIGTDGFGEYAFKVHAEHKTIKPVAVVDVPEMTVAIEEAWDGFTIAGANDDLNLNVAVETYNGVIGTFVLNNLKLDETTINYKGNDLTPLTFGLNISAKEVAEIGYAYVGKLTFIGSDFVQYNVPMIAPMPTPTDTVEITCVNMKLEPYNGQINFSASDAIYTIYGAWLGDEIVAGTYSGNEAAVEISNAETYDYYRALATTIVVSGNEVDGWVVDVVAYCPDNKLYKMHLSWYVPEPTDTIVVAFENSAKGRFYPEYGNDLQLFNENDQYYASINISNIDLNSPFTEDDMFPMFSGVEVNVDGEYLPVEYALVQNGYLSQVEDTTKMYAEYVTFDGKLYQVNLWHAVPTPTEVVEVTYENAQFVNDMDWGGVYSLLAYGPDSLTAMVISGYAYSEEEISGTYVNDGMFGLFGEGQYEFDAGNTYYGIWNEEIESYDLIYADKGEFTITLDEEKNILLTGSIICENAIQYNVTMKSKIERARLEGDSEDTPVDRTFSSNDHVVINDYTSDYGPIYFEVASLDYMDMFNFYLMAEASDPDIVLPVGTYEITDTYEYGTVIAGMGIDMWSGSVEPGYYAGITDDGYVTYPFYFLVEGTVEVSKNEAGLLHIEVNAINSYEVPVHIVYDATPVTPAEPVEMVGVVKRAVQNGDTVIVLTHEENGAAHIYEVVNGVAVAEISQEGVIAVDPENAGDFLAISDIAVTEDGKLVATNYMITQSGDDQVAAGDKRGETRIYLWDDLAGAPSILFTSKMSSNWFQSKQGLTMAVKGTSDNMEIFMTGIHKSKAWARVSSYRVIEGVYVEPDVNNNDYYHFYDVADAVALETTVGTQYELTASPLGAMNWILDAELINPVEIVEPETNNVEISSCVALSADLGKKYNGATYVTVGEQHLMVAPYATAEGLLAGVKVLDITAGLAAAVEVNVLDLDAPVEATAAATAVQVVENGLNINLVADATIYPLTTVAEGPEYMVIEDNITNLVIDLESMAIIGGPSTMWQVEVFLGLAEDDNMDGQWSLSPESSVAIMGFDARFIDGYVYDIDVNAPAAKAVLYVEDSGFFYEIRLDMTSAAPADPIAVVVENATITIDTIPLFGDAVDYALKMTADWTYAEDGVTYPVLVEVPVYYPEATEPSEMTCTVTIGGMGDDDPWLGFGEGTLTITTVDGVVTAKGLV